jgi:sulfur carrier protein ThiS adenylyltransferase
MKNLPTKAAVAETPVEFEKRVSFQRHSSWFNPALAECRVIVIGCGAVGSNAALLAARMGFMRFDLWDKDQVEPHNLPNQAYDVEHIGMQKVNALASVLKRFNPEVDVTIHEEFFTKDSTLHEGGPMILATDSFDSRRVIAEVFKLNPQIQGVFETRLGFDFGQVNLVDNLDSEQVDIWLNSLGNDAETPEGPCNRKICGTLVFNTVSFLIHQMCDRMIQDAAGEPWLMKDRRRTMFHFSPNLTVRSLCRTEPTE